MSNECVQTHSLALEVAFFLVAVLGFFGAAAFLGLVAFLMVVFLVAVFLGAWNNHLWDIQHDGVKKVPFCGKLKKYQLNAFKLTDSFLGAAFFLGPAFFLGTDFFIGAAFFLGAVFFLGAFFLLVFGTDFVGVLDLHKNTIDNHLLQGTQVGGPQVSSHQFFWNQKQ